MISLNFYTTNIPSFIIYCGLFIVVTHTHTSCLADTYTQSLRAIFGVKIAFCDGTSMPAKMSYNIEQLHIHFNTKVLGKKIATNVLFC